MTKTFQHLKQWQPTRIVAALSLESVRIVSRYKVHKRLKTAVAFKTLFCSQSLMGTPLFIGDVFQENTHVVVSFSDLRTQAYHEKVLKPVFDVFDYWYCYELAKSRGQIHWHQLSLRDNRQPHKLLYEACEDNCSDKEYAARLSQWVSQNCSQRMCMSDGVWGEFRLGKKLHSVPEIVEDQNGAPRLEMSRDHPCVVQHPRYQM